MRRHLMLMSLCLIIMLTATVLAVPMPGLHDQRGSVVEQPASTLLANIKHESLT